MATYGTLMGEKFAAQAVKLFFEKAATPEITNQDWEGELKAGGANKVNIKTFGLINIGDYTPKTDMTLQDPSESEGELELTQKKYFYFRIDNLDKFFDYVKDPSSTMLQTVAGSLAETIDAYTLSFYADVAAGNRVGTDYTTGTVEVTTGTGAVTGTGTTFTSAMVGRGFKAAGHTKWYRVKTYTSATAIVIEDDKDDETSAYTGGAISSGSTYVIEAATAITLDKDNIYGKVLALKRKLDEAKVPQSDRWLVGNARFFETLLQSGSLLRSVDAANEHVYNGYVGMLAGFKLYSNEQVAGDNTTGYWFLAGHKSFITFAMGYVESDIENINKQFGKAYKGLNVYGAKVLDERRKAGAALFGKF